MAEMRFPQLHRILQRSFAPDRFNELYRVMPSREVDARQWDTQINFWTEILTRWIRDSEIVRVRVCENYTIFSMGRGITSNYSNNSTFNLHETMQISRRL